MRTIPRILVGLALLPIACASLASAQEPAKPKAPRWPFLATDSLAEERGRLIVSKVDPARMEERWTVDFATAGQPTADILSQLGTRLGMQIETRAVKRELAATVQADLRGKSLLEALETVVAESKCHVNYPVAFGPWSEEWGKLRVESGPREFPVAFAGPFLVEVNRLEEFPPRGAGSLKLRMRAIGLHPAVLKALGNCRAMTISSIENTEGQNLLNTDVEEGPLVFIDEADMNRFTFGDESPLRNLLRGVTALTARGTLTLPLPTKVAWGELKSMKKGAKLKIAGDTMRLDEIGPGDPIGDQSVTRLTLGWGDWFEFDHATFVARDAKGDLLETFANKGDGTYPNGQAIVEVIGQPASVVVKVVQETEERTYDFTIEGIPLAKAAEQPERIEAPKFTGDAPITVELLVTKEGDETKKLLRCVNHSDQPIHKVKVGLTYFDAAGEEIETDTTEADGGEDFMTDELKPLVEPGQTAEVRPGFLILPKTFAKAAAVPTEVWYVNGMVWRAETGDDADAAGEEGNGDDTREEEDGEAEDESDPDDAGDDESETDNDATEDDDDATP